MPNTQLTPDQLTKLSEISNPLVRQRFTVFYQLPQDMQDTFVSENTTNNVWNIAKEKYQLSDVNVSAVARIIGLIFLGELPIKNFIIALQKDLNVDVETAQNIAKDINMAIFQPVRQSLMQVHGLASDTNTRMHANDTNNNEQNPNISNNQKPVAEPRRQIQYQQPTRPAQSDDYGAKRRREEVLNKIKTQPPARPAMFRMIPNKNVVNLRVLAKKKHNKNHYDGFFTA